MTRFLLAVLLTLITTTVSALPTDALVTKVRKHVVKVHVALDNGRYGSGSGVVIAKDQIVTNCHVVGHALSVSIVANGTTYHAKSITPDWYHDVCLVNVDGLDAPIANMIPSTALQYEQPVVNVGYPNASLVPNSTAGYIKGLFPMDDSLVIRASSTFRLGQSGGGLFDQDGNLVGIITLKSPGRHAYYYNMPVEWVQALLNKPEQPITSQPEKAFWATSADHWPNFMKVVHPYLTKDWKNLHKIAKTWADIEPNNIEAWFYLAASEYANHDNANAETHLRKVMAMNAGHSQAIYYLALVAEQNGRHIEAMTNVALLTKLDSDAAIKLKVALKALH